MKNTLRWDNLTSPELKKLAADNAVVLLPLGSTEQHGPHLPVGTDALLATWMSERACAALRQNGVAAVVAPTFAVANSMHHMSFAGSLSIRPMTYMQALLEQCRAIAAHGFTRIALVNGHGGNTAPTKAALVDINLELGFPVYLTDYLPGVDESAVLESQKGMIHACESETSLVLAMDETLVDPVYKETKGYPGDATAAEDKNLVSTFHRMEAHTKNGVMGNSYLATREKGERLAAAGTAALCAVLSDPELWNKRT